MDTIITLIHQFNSFEKGGSAFHKMLNLCKESIEIILIYDKTHILKIE